MAFGSCKQWNLTAPIAVLEGREAPQKVFIIECQPERGLNLCGI